MIYDPSRAALEVKRRIFEIMTPDEQRAYLLSVPASVEQPRGKPPAKHSEDKVRSQNGRRSRP